MIIKQISVFIENRQGTLKEVLKVLADAKINIRALSLADTTDFGILRLIADRPEDAEKALKDDDIMVTLTNVIALDIKDESGGLSMAVEELSANGITIEYMYAFIGKSHGEAMVICKVADVKRAIEIAKNSNITLVPASKVYAI